MTQVPQRIREEWDNDSFKTVFRKICSTIHVDDFSLPINVHENRTLSSLSHQLNDPTVSERLYTFIQNESDEGGELFLSHGWYYTSYVMCFKKRKYSKLYIAYCNNWYFKRWTFPIIGAASVGISSRVIYSKIPVLTEVTSNWFLTNKEKIMNWYGKVSNAVGTTTLLKAASKIIPLATKDFVDEEELKGAIYEACLAFKLYSSYNDLQGSEIDGIESTISRKDHDQNFWHCIRDFCCCKHC